MTYVPYLCVTDGTPFITKDFVDCMINAPMYRTWIEHLVHQYKVDFFIQAPTRGSILSTMEFQSSVTALPISLLTLSMELLGIERNWMMSGWIHCLHGLPFTSVLMDMQQ